MRAAGIEPPRALSPTDFQIFIPATVFTAAHQAFVVWTIPSPSRDSFRCCPSSLYTFPLPGLARDGQENGFPEFEQFCQLMGGLHRRFGGEQGGNIACAVQDGSVPWSIVGV